MAAAATLVFAAGDLVAAAEISAFPNPSDPRMAVLVFFGVEEDGAGAGAAAGIAAGLLRFIGFLAPFVTAPIFVSSLHLSFLSQPYQVTFTAAQPLAAIVVVFVTVLNYLGVRTVGRVQIFLTALKIATIIAILVFGVMANNPTSDRTALVESPAHGPIVAFLTALVPVMYATSDFNISVSWAGKF